MVDDEPDLRYLLRRVFERAGYEVAECGNGATALEAALRSPPDLVVTDMMMPVMGGAELVRRLRADAVTAQIPILAVTGDAHLAGGADAVLAKPWTSQLLLTTATALMAQKADRT
ncbi:response regulator [Actinoplanes solisilvae]|uniref:response regulator n=1 Tax=Actinoplanes solisilvae TaxID=2486853 RepID=UPI001F0BB4D1|nr:response regulator [Actinoplanes solisilvae]